MDIKTKYKPGDTVWYFRNRTPTKTEIKKIVINIFKTNKTYIDIKYVVLRDIAFISEEKLADTQQELYTSLE